MGAESSILKECELGEPYKTAHNHLELCPAFKKDGSPVSVFIHEESALRKSQRSSDGLQSAAEHLKVLRHPRILRYFNYAKLPEGTVLITEAVKPLELEIENLTSLEICSGIHNIIEALGFLHDKCQLSHNNVSMTSVYVAEDGSWKLGGMENLCTFCDANVEYLEKCRPYRDAKSIPPEEKNGECSVDAKNGHARDAYSFGVFVLHAIEYILADSCDNIISLFEMRVQKELLNANFDKRVKLSSLLDDDIFRNALIESSNFLRNLTLKSDEEKEHFFSSLAGRLEQLSQKLVAKRLVPDLVSRLVFLDPAAVNHFLPHLLSARSSDHSTADSPASHSVLKPSASHVRPLLELELFRSCIVPRLLHIFRIRDLHVRLTLLRLLPLYVTSLEPDTLRDHIMPEILLGLRDVNDELVSLSLISLAHLVPVLGGGVVIGGQRHPHFRHGLPGSKSVQNSTPSGTPGLRNVGQTLRISNKLTNDSPNHKPSSQAVLDSEKRQKELDAKREALRLRREERKQQKQERKRVEHIETSEQGRRDEIETSRHAADDVESLREVAPPREESNQWSDWEVEERDAVIGREEEESDAVIGREIEHELDLMPATSTFTRGTGAQNGFVLYEEGADWRTEKCKIPVARSPNEKKLGQTSAENGQEKMDVEAQEPKRRIGHDEPLGFGLDVKSIAVHSRRSPEEDFFAGMEPELPGVAMSAATRLDEVAEMAVRTAARTAVAGKFDVTTAEEQEEPAGGLAAGWEDGGWEDF